MGFAVRMRMSMLFFMCALTRLSGHIFRFALEEPRLHALALRLLKERGAAWGSSLRKALPWVWTVELIVALVGAILPLDGMRFAAINLTSSYGKVGGVLPGELSLALQCGLLLSVVMVQSGVAVNLVLRTGWKFWLPIASLIPM